MKKTIQNEQIEEGINGKKNDGISTRFIREIDSKFRIIQLCINLNIFVKQAISSTKKLSIELI